jgi:hypothetical protein
MWANKKLTLRKRLFDLLYSPCVAIEWRWGLEIEVAGKCSRCAKRDWGRERCGF